LQRYTGTFRLGCYVEREARNSTEKGGAAEKKVDRQTEKCQAYGDGGRGGRGGVSTNLRLGSTSSNRKKSWEQQLQQRQQHQQVVFGDLSDGWGAGVEPRNDKSTEPPPPPLHFVSHPQPKETKLVFPIDCQCGTRVHIYIFDLCQPPSICLVGLWLLTVQTKQPLGIVIVRYRSIHFQADGRQ